ncbi:hypothetical protein AcV5_002565 [Taiwanofungus camphoratus]|nr:hypothetical protein AcV5_002565 [Antrodia cinnamomea]
MTRSAQVLLILLCIIVFCIPGDGVYAFGAGNIPSFAYLEGRAFRHGDIEDTLSEIAKKTGGFALGALIGKGGSKFGGLDVKRVYFGNWLRDYSQAVDVAGLQKLPLQTIINLCMVLGFMAHGYATGEFEVTIDRLGVYLPIEHIDNPKGYPDNAQSFDRRLRGPVDPRELDVDPRTGMKNYIANENGFWDTSKALVRRTLHRCIEVGRRHRAHGLKQDEYEAYRLLGQALHTLEDFTAHSNFCELALASLGYNDVFLHVGDQVRIQAPDGRWVAPLVTGTFGSSDFIHSLLGEATDQISQASVVDLNAELDKARAISASGAGAPADRLRELLFKLPDGSGGEMQREMETVERIRAGAGRPSSKAPEEMSPQELHTVLWQVLTFRDSVMKNISMTIEKIPGLGPLIEKISDSVSVFVFTTLEPFLRPIMKQATSGLMAASSEVIDNHDQYEVFDNPRVSDPTHSFLSKDHFSLILNEPAGHLGTIILTHTTNLIVKAWDNPSINVHQVTDDILHCLFHPDFHDQSSTIQREMMQYMQTWVQGLGNHQAEILQRLTRQSVRNHLNVRHGGRGPAVAQGTFTQTAGQDMQHGLLANVPGLSQAQSLLGKVGGGPSDSGHSPFSALGHPQLLGTVGAGSARTSMATTEGITSPGYPGMVYGSGHSDRHGRNHHQHVRATDYPYSSGQVSTYYNENHILSMPIEDTQVYPGPLSHHVGRTSSPSYAPPLGPPPSFPSGGPVLSMGYAPVYMGAHSSHSFPSADPEPSYPSYVRDEGRGYSTAYAPSPPGGPRFADAHAPPPGPPPFPGEEGYPPPGTYDGPSQSDRRYGW